MKRLVFYNVFHNGDIHVSREFVKDILNKTNLSNPIYYHPNSPKLLKDVNVEHSREKINFQNVLFYEDENNVYVNTWFHLDHGYKHFQCTMEALMYNFNVIYKGLGIPLEDKSFYIPKIDYSVFELSQIDDYFNNHKFDKYIYVSNGRTLSGQSDNMNMDNFIKTLSDKYKNCLFILTDHNSKYIENDNIILSQSIIGSNGFDDLIENSYLSTKCDVIIGRNSGPSTFSIVVENVLSDKKQDILEMSYYFPFLNESYYNKNKKLYHVQNTTYILEYVNKIIENK